LQLGHTSVLIGYQREQDYTEVVLMHVYNHTSTLFYSVVDNKYYTFKNYIQIRADDAYFVGEIYTL